jgi:hypothetical protein
MYDIKILEDKKVIHVTTGGFMKAEEAVEILNSLKKTFQAIDTSKYYFILDSSNFKAAAQENINLLTDVITLYAQTPFIKKFVILPISSIAKMQAQKTDKTDLPSYIIKVDSFEEAMALIK